MAQMEPSKAAGAAVNDPLVDLQHIKDFSCVPPEQSHYLIKLLLARMPQNRKVNLSVHLYPKALDLIAQHDLWKMLLPFGPFLFKYRSHFVKLPADGETKLTLPVQPLAFEDPLSNPYETRDSVNYFYLLKLLLARLPINDRVKVTYPLLALAVGYMHQNRLWTELSLYNPSWSWLKLSPTQNSNVQVQQPHTEQPHYGPTLHEFNNEQTICLPKLSRPQSVGYGSDGQYSPCTSQERSRDRDRGEYEYHSSSFSTYVGRGNVGRSFGGRSRCRRYSSGGYSPRCHYNRIGYDRPHFDSWMSQPVRMTQNSQWSLPVVSPGCTSSPVSEKSKASSDFQKSSNDCQTPFRPTPGVSYPTDGTTYTYSNNRTLIDISSTIEACKYKLSYPQAKETTPTSPVKSDFIDWSAPPSIAPSPTLPTVLAPSTFYPQSRQWNQHYNNDKQRNRQPRNRNRSGSSWNQSPNQQQRQQSFTNESTEAPNWKPPLAIQHQEALLSMPSLAAASTAVDYDSIDWSASPCVDSAEASAKLDSSFKIAPECTDVIYRNERSQQGPTRLNPGSRIFYPSQSVVSPRPPSRTTTPSGSPTANYNSSEPEVYDAEDYEEKEKEVVVVKDAEVDPFASHKIFCHLCTTSEHSMVNCPEAPSTKMLRIGELKLCEKCLSPGHLASNCDMTGLVVCVTCGLDHFDYIYHKPTEWTINQWKKQASVEKFVYIGQLKKYFRESTTGLELPMPSCNTSSTDLKDLLGTDGSDTATPIQPISTQQLLISFDELTIA